MPVRAAATTRLRVGLAGAGAMGANHLRLLLRRPDLDVVAVAEPDGAARAAAERLVADAGARSPIWFDGAWAMLAEEGLDAVVIATPTETHAATVEAAIARGVAALVEKPLAADPEAAGRLVQAVASTGAFVQVGHVERFNPAVRRLATAVGEGLCGEILAVRAIRTGPRPRNRLTTGVALDLATHDVDIICELLGSEPVRAAAEVTLDPLTGVDTLVIALLHFAGGATATIEASWLSPDKVRTLEVVGSNGVLRVDYLRRSLVMVTSDGGETSLIDGFAPLQRGHRRAVAVPREEPLALQLDDFVARVVDGRPPSVDVQAGARAVRLMAAVLASSGTGEATALAGGEP